jgi:predicted amidohydrolase
MTLVAGAPVRIGPALCIGAFIVVPGGTLALYTKRHLGAFQPDVNPAGVVPPAEDTVFRPGERDPLVPFGEHTAALAVCSDTGRPEHSDAAARRGATTYLASMFVIPADYEGEAARLESTAGRHSMAVVMANFGGPSGGLASGGGSAIWSDRGELLVRLDAAGSGVAVAREDEAGWSARAVML